MHVSTEYLIEALVVKTVFRPKHSLLCHYTKRVNKLMCQQLNVSPRKQTR